MTPQAALDHLTVATLTFEQGIAYIRRALNVDIPFGGAHPLMGTHNCLMQIGDAIFLEVIAPDPAVTPQRARWFGLDDPEMRALAEDHEATVGSVIRVPRGELSG